MKCNFILLLISSFFLLAISYDKPIQKPDLVGNYNLGFISCDSTSKDSLNLKIHYWTLKTYLNPQIESVRIDPNNYEDNGPINQSSIERKCDSGYVELCGICVIPDPQKTSIPYFNKEVNNDIFYALKANHFLESEVFYRDL